MSNVYVPSTGRYYLQFLCDERLTIRFGNTLFEKFALPMFHNEVKEIPLDLKKGRTQLKVHLSNDTSQDLSPKFTARLLDEDGYVLFPERIAPLPEIGEYRLVGDKPALNSWTPGAGKGFRSFGRFGFSKGDGVLDWSMPSFGIIARPYVSGHPDYHRNLIWRFSLLPDGEEPSGSLYKTYHLPENESISNDWSGVRWTRRLKNGKSLTFDYSLLTPALLVETDLDYLNISSLRGISAWKRIALPLADGVHLRSVEDAGDGICYDRARDGALSRNYLLLASQSAFPDVPLQLVLKRSPERIRIQRDERGRIDGFRIEFDGAMEWLMMLFPCGIELFKPHEMTEERILECVSLCQKHAQRALARPVSCTDYYRATQEKVEVTQLFSYRRLEDEWNSPCRYFAPLPPPLSLADGHVDAIRLDARCVREKYPTKYGYLYGVEDSTFSSYVLPVPDTKRDLAFPAERHEELRKKLEQDFDEFMSYHLDAPEVGNPGNYSFVFQYSFVLMVFHLLSPEKRWRLEAAIREGLKKVCDPSCSYVGPEGRTCYTWYNRTEPFSGLDFNMTYLHVGGVKRFRNCDKETIENTDILMVETDWGNAMSLYGTYFGALFTDSWEMIRENWHVFRHAFDYYLHSMDWACMCAPYCENGVSWNDGTNYGGYLGFVNMAEMLGMEDELALGRYAFSKMFAMRAGLFHASQYYFYKYLNCPKWYCAKFFHEETDAGRAFLSYPESIIYNGYRIETLYNITTEGHYKEALDAYCGFMGGEMVKMLKAFEHSNEKAPWEERPEGAPDLYHTPSSGVPGWQEVYSYFMCCIRLELMSRHELEARIEEALKNKRISRDFLGTPPSMRRVPAYWTYAYLLSNLFGKDEVKLTSWKNLDIVRAQCPELEIVGVKEDAFLECRSAHTPVVSLNGEKMEATPAGSGLWRIFPRQNGVIRFGEEKVMPENQPE